MMRPSLRGQRLLIEAVLQHACSEAMAELQQLPQRPADGLMVERAVRAWCDRWHLPDNWARRLIQQQVTEWRANPKKAGKFIGSVQSEWLPLWPSAPSWDPDDQDDKTYLGRITQYMEQVRGLPDFAVARATRNADRDLEWLVRYQVNGETYSSLAKELPLAARERPETTPRHAVRRLAQMIGVTLRAPLRTGRPTKVRT